MTAAEDKSVFLLLSPDTPSTLCSVRTELSCSFNYHSLCTRLIAENMSQDLALPKGSKQVGLHPQPWGRETEPFADNCILSCSAGLH